MPVPTADDAQPPVAGQRVVRRALGRRLMRLRNARDMTRRQVAEARLGISEPTLHRIETGKVPVTPANVRALCWLYKTDQSVADALAELALGTSQAQWWESSPHVPDWFKLYVGLEASASAMDCYEAELVPGEYQTEAYARALFAATGATQIDEQVRLRLRRQRNLFTRRPAPKLVTVLNEAALVRPVGGDAVLKGQIEHLRRVAEQHDNVDIRILPWSIGAHAAMTGAFRILTFDEPDDPDVVYLEQHVGALYLEDPAEVDEYRRIFASLVAAAVPVIDYR